MSACTSTQNDATSESFEYAAGFQPARPRKNRKNRKNGPVVQKPLAETFSQTRQELVQGANDWLKETKDLIRESSSRLFSASSPEVLCLGLGSPAANRDPRAQLVFLLEVCDYLSLDHSKISVYDPVFSEKDDRLLETLKIRKLTENKNAAYEVHNPTLAYMPHCDLHLYENLLRENWSSGRLPNLLLIANRFSEYVDNVPSHKLSSEYPCVSRIAPILTSSPLAPCPSHPTAFNNIAIQYALVGNLPPDSERSFWELPPTSERILGA